MSNIEKMYSKARDESTVHNHDYNHDERRDFYFRAIIQSSLMDTIQGALEESGFPLPDIDLFTTALAELPEKDQLTVLSLPLEIRGRLLSNYHKQVAEGKMTPADVVHDLLTKFKKHGFTLGYHLSSHQVPRERNRNGEETWNIKGTELDDRDNRLMAYYSEDYLNRYKKKAGNFLYVVRSEMGPNSSHKHDLKNHWGRAASLSIIDEYDMSQVERRIDEAMEKERAATPELE
ncbi:MAG: hypothetical protein G01um101449_142 [Parcubacteria group bacterium Gr01-1014_49]|nr:MAG: hypothetical protein G01um101449_142 [Parcubacteria group bacterium Gr01-1014_49]